MAPMVHQRGSSRPVGTRWRANGREPDAHLAALAIERGLPVGSADRDFGRFQDVRRVDPPA